MQSGAIEAESGPNKKDWAEPSFQTIEKTKKWMLTKWQKQKEQKENETKTENENRNPVQIDVQWQTELSESHH